MRTQLFYILFLLPILASAQIGGQSTFQALNFSTSAKIEGLGGYQLTVKDSDATLGQENPALLNRTMHGQVNLNYINYFANSNFGFASYTKHYSNVGTFNASLLYADFGKFDYANISGDRDGTTFRASDLALSLGYGRPLNEKWSVGAQLRLLGSFYESYSAFGSSMDFGVNYSDTAKGFGFGAVVKNAGIQFKSYTAGSREPLPFNIAVGISKKMEHAPFRFTFTYDNLHKWNLVYFDDTQSSTIDPLTGEVVEIKSPGALVKLAYHLTFGTELLLSENFHLRVGYNHMNRQTLKVGIKQGLTGFSLGFGIKVKSIYLSYALAKYHIAGTSNHITISKRFGKVPEVDGFYRQHD